MNELDRRIAELPLTKGYVAIIDASDYEILSRWKWTAHVKAHTVYAMRRQWIDGKKVNIQLHRQILSAPADLVVDHINGNGLDNRRCNLRLCEKSTNSQNLHRRKRGTIYQGVEKLMNSKSYRARIRIGGKDKHLGCFATAEEAAGAYDAAAVKLFGAKAKLNFPAVAVTWMREKGK